MAKEEKRVLTLDKYEHGVVINALNEMRNDLIGENRPTDAVDDVLLKAIDAPTRKVRGKVREERWKPHHTDSVYLWPDSRDLAGAPDCSCSIRRLAADSAALSQSHGEPISY